MTSLAAVSEQLAGFVHAAALSGLNAETTHEAKRLLLNQLKASAEAVHRPAARPLHDWAAAGPAARRHDAHVMWVGTRTAPPRAAAVNAMLCDLLDYGDTHLATGHHASAAVVAAALAQGEAGGHGGQAVLTAIVLGVETGIACARLFTPDGDGDSGSGSGGSGPALQVAGVGAAAACCVLAGLDVERTAHALRLALSTAAVALAGPGAQPYVTGMAAQSGHLACTLARRDWPAPAGAFGTDIEALWPRPAARTGGTTHNTAHSTEQVLSTLGHGGLLLAGIAMHTWPAPAWAQAPIEAALLGAAAAEGVPVRSLRLSLPAPAWQRARAGTPSGMPALQERVAAAWLRGEFTADELQPAALADPALAALAASMEVVQAPGPAGVDGSAGCTLEVQRADGTRASHTVEHFLGSPGQPLSDSQLSELFRSAAEDLVLPARAGEILQALWSLHTTPDVRSLMVLLRPPPR